MSDQPGDEGAERRARRGDAKNSPKSPRELPSVEDALRRLNDAFQESYEIRCALRAARENDGAGGCLPGPTATAQ